MKIMALMVLFRGYKDGTIQQMLNKGYVIV